MGPYMVTYWCVSECCSLIGSHRLYVYRNGELEARKNNSIIFSGQFVSMFRQYDRVIEEMASPTNNLSVVDVYDIAASIGKEFELIIDNHGPEAVTELMPKVITVLEHLENLASRNQKENAEIVELRYAVEKLQAEKAAKAEQRERYEQVRKF